MNRQIRYRIYRLAGKKDKSFWPRMMHVATGKVQVVMGTYWQGVGRGRGGCAQSSLRVGRGSRNT